MAMTISKPVGLKAFGQTPSDVKLVQLALQACKTKKFKPFYSGKIDGKAGPKTVEAICTFQRENNLPVTGKVEREGPTMTRLRLKTPQQIKTALDKSGGGGHGAVGLLDHGKIKSGNAILIKGIETWPLPTSERAALMKWVKACTENYIALIAKAPPVDIAAQGHFTVAFGLPDWALGPFNEKQKARTEMTNKACDLMAGISGWQKGDPTTLTFKTVKAYSVLAHPGILKPQDRALAGLPDKQCPIQEKCAAAAVKVINAEKGKISNETKGDILGTVTTFSQAVFDAYAEGMGEFKGDAFDKFFKKGQKIVDRKFKAVDVLFTSGKILMQGEGQIETKVVVGEVSAMAAGWALSGLATSAAKAAAGAALITASATTIGIIAALAGAGVALWYIWWGGDEWVNEHASKLWEHIEAGTWMDYLRTEVDLAEMRRLIAEASKAAIDDMIKYFTPTFEAAYIDYSEQYAKASIGKGMQVYDWVNPFIKKLLQAAGIPTFKPK